MRTGMMESAFAKAIRLVFRCVDGVETEFVMAQRVYAALDMPFEVDKLSTVGLDRCFTGPEGECTGVFSLSARSLGDFIGHCCQLFSRP